LFLINHRVVVIPGTLFIFDLFSRTMIRKSYKGLSLWQFDLFSREPHLNHFVTERTPGDNGHEFTLSFSSHPDASVIRDNRHRLASAMEIDPGDLYFPSQVHKTRIVTVTSSTTKDDLMETDALITAEKGRCVAVMSADCVPVLLYDKRNNVVAAVHSGWRGTVALILTKTLQALRKDYGTRGGDVIAGIGPSVSRDAYEVGAEVITSVRQVFARSADRLLEASTTDKARLDLWKANTMQLEEFGVPHSQIEVSNLCTIRNNDYFFSARRGDKGRFAAGIVMV
jgi:polyphenol oxidase